MLLSFSSLFLPRMYVKVFGTRIDWKSLIQILATFCFSYSTTLSLSYWTFLFLFVSISCLHTAASNEKYISICLPLHVCILVLNIIDPLNVLPFLLSLTCLRPGLPRPVHGDLHALGVDGDLGRARADADRKVEALAWKRNIIFKGD